MYPILASDFSGILELFVWFWVHAGLALAALIYLISLCFSPPKAGWRGLPSWLPLVSSLCVPLALVTWLTNRRFGEHLEMTLILFSTAPAIAVLCFAARCLSSKLHRKPKPRITQHHDVDIGKYHYCLASESWFYHLQMEFGDLVVRGRSTQPTPEQKRLIEHFLPLLASLKAEVQLALEPPKGFEASEVPQELVLRELRFESTGGVELFFDPGLRIDGYEMTPVGTFSADGRLLSAAWSV